MGSIGAMAGKQGSSDRYFQEGTSSITENWCLRASRAGSLQGYMINTVISCLRHTLQHGHLRQHPEMRTKPERSCVTNVA